MDDNPYAAPQVNRSEAEADAAAVLRAARGFDAADPFALAEFYARLRTSESLPTTSQPTPGDFLDATRRATFSQMVKSWMPGPDVSIVNVVCMAEE